MEEEEYEGLEDGEISEEYDHRKNRKAYIRLPMGWKEEQTGLLIKGQYAFAILDIYNFPTQYWNAENGEKPTLEPIGWKSEDLLKYGITSDSMNKWLLSNQVADNWNKGLQELRTNLSVELPGAHKSPSYAATSPGYVVISSPDYSSFSPEYQAVTPIESPEYKSVTPIKSLRKYPNVTPPQSPEYASSSPEYSAVTPPQSPEYPQMTPPTETETILIVIPYNEPLDGIEELSGGGNVDAEIDYDNLSNIEDIIKEAESLDSNPVINSELFQVGGRVNNKPFRENFKIAPNN